MNVALSWPYLIMAFVIIQRVSELALSNKNTKLLLKRGAQEYYKGHYKWMVLLHTLWIVAIFVSITPQTPVIWSFVFLFAGLQVFRYWVIYILGPYWTTRIISHPDFPRIKRGPYRFINHPNYLVVAIEIFTLPLAFGFYTLSAVFGFANLALLAYRIHCENKALSLRKAAS